MNFVPATQDRSTFLKNKTSQDTHGSSVTVNSCLFMKEKSQPKRHHFKRRRMKAVFNCQLN